MLREESQVHKHKFYTYVESKEVDLIVGASKIIGTSEQVK